MTCLWHKELNLDNMGEGERQYLKVPKDDAEMMMNKLVSAGLLDEESEVKWEGEFVSFPLKEGLLIDKS